MAAGDHFGVEREAGAARRRWRPCVSAARTAKPSTLERSNGGTSIGAATSCASTRAERRRERHGLGRERREIEMPRKARARFLGRDHFEELLLPRGAADRREQIGRVLDLLSERSFMARVLPRPPRRPDSLRCRPAPGSIRRPAPSPAAADSPRLWARLCRRGSAPARPRHARAGKRPCARAWRVVVGVSSAAAGQPRQQGPAERQPDRQRRIEAAGHQQHRAAPDDAEGRGLARRERDAVHLDAAEARQRAHARVVAAAAGAADGDDGVGALVLQRCPRSPMRRAVQPTAPPPSAPIARAIRPRAASRIASSPWARAYDANARLAHHHPRDRRRRRAPPSRPCRSAGPAAISAHRALAIGSRRQHAVARRRPARAPRTAIADRDGIERRDRIGARRQRLADIDPHGRRQRRRRVGAGIGRSGRRRPPSRHAARSRAGGSGPRDHVAAPARGRAPPRARPRAARPASTSAVDAREHVVKRRQPRDPLRFVFCRHGAIVVWPRRATDEGTNGVEMTEKTMNLRGLKCPLPALRTRKALGGMAKGDCWSSNAPTRSPASTSRTCSTRPATRWKEARARRRC